MELYNIEDRNKTVVFTDLNNPAPEPTGTVFTNNVYDLIKLSRDVIADNKIFNVSSSVKNIVIILKSLSNATFIINNENVKLIKNSLNTIIKLSNLTNDIFNLNDIAENILRPYVEKNIPVLLTENELLKKINNEIKDEFSKKTIAEYAKLYINEARKNAIDITGEPINFKFNSEKVRLKDAIKQIDTAKEFIVYKAPMADGKSTQAGKLTTDITNKTQNKCNVITSRVSNIHAQAKHHKNLKTYDENGLQADKFSGLITTTNSFSKILLKKYRENTSINIIDEACETLEHMASTAAGYNIENRNDNFKEIKEVLSDKKNTQVFMDAHISERDIKELEKLTGKKAVLYGKKTKYDKKIEYAIGKKSGIKMVIDFINAGEKVFLSTDGRVESVKEMINAIKKQCDKKINSIYINKETKAELNNKAKNEITLNERLKTGNFDGFDLVVVSPVITTGISLENNYFTKSVSFFNGTISLKSALQTTQRVRDLKVINIVFQAKTKYDLRMPLEMIDFGDGELKEKVLNNKADDYKEYFEFCLSEAKQRKETSTNFANKMLYILEAQGFEIKKLEDQEVSKELEKSLKEAHKENRKAIIERTLKASIVDTKGFIRLMSKRKNGTLSEKERATLVYNELFKTFGKINNEIIELNLNNENAVGRAISRAKNIKTLLIKPELKDDEKPSDEYLKHILFSKCFEILNIDLFNISAFTHKKKRVELLNFIKSGKIEVNGKAYKASRIFEKAGGINNRFSLEKASYLSISNRFLEMFGIKLDATKQLTTNKEEGYIREVKFEVNTEFFNKILINLPGLKVSNKKVAA